MRNEQLLFALLRTAVCGEPLSEDAKAACTAEKLEYVYEVASSHDLAHLIGYALRDFDLPECEALKKCKIATKQAIFRYVRMDACYGEICAALEKAKIPYIPLKGAVLREYYPDPWMRTSCDIDILVKEEMLDSAVAMLQENLRFTANAKGDHDIVLISPTGVHFELHYDTVPEGKAVNEMRAVLGRIWEDATPIQPGAYQYALSDAMFYFYHVAHMTKHLHIGGCGVRSFMDLWILNNRVSYDDEARKQLLAEGDLLAFDRGAKRMTDIWFADGEMDQMMAFMEEFVLLGGLYGNMANQVTVNQTKKGNKFVYTLSRIFLPYDKMQYKYPVLQKHKWLLPFCHISRWFKLVFKGGLKRAVREVKFVAAISQDQQQIAQDMLEYLGIK